MSNPLQNRESTESVTSSSSALPNAASTLDTTPPSVGRQSQHYHSRPANIAGVPSQPAGGYSASLSLLTELTAGRAAINTQAPALDTRITPLPANEPGFSEATRRILVLVFFAVLTGVVGILIYGVTKNSGLAFGVVAVVAPFLVKIAEFVPVKGF